MKLINKSSRNYSFETIVLESGKTVEIDENAEYRTNTGVLIDVENAIEVLLKQEGVEKEIDTKKLNDLEAENERLKAELKKAKPKKTSAKRK